MKKKVYFTHVKLKKKGDVLHLFACLLGGKIKKHIFGDKMQWSW